MALIKLPDNGQEFEVDDGLVATDDDVRRLVSPVYPEAANASIKRAVHSGQLVIEMVKRAGTKGASVSSAEEGPLIAEAEEGQEAVELDLAAVRTDGNTQTRAMTSRDTAQEYAEAIASGAVFPPVKVVLDEEGNYWLWDGFHTTMAFGIAGRSTVRALVTRGTKRDAVLLAVGANQAHGLRRTNDDKRRAVTILLRDDEWREWSDRVIAERVGVSHTFVSNVRRELYPTDAVHLPHTRTVERGGQTYTFRPAATEEDQKTAGQQSMALPATQEFDAPTGAPLTGVLPASYSHMEEVAPEQDSIELSTAGESAPSPEPMASAPSASVSEGPVFDGSAPSLIPATPAPAPSPSPLKPVQPKVVPLEQSEVTITLMLKPEDNDEAGRTVVMMANCPGLSPVVKAHRLNMYTPWQDPISEALSAFREQIEAKMEAAK